MLVRRPLALLLLALAGAGCLEGGAPPSSDAAPPDATWYLGGAWTEGYTQADIDAWCEIAQAYDNECVVMESYPPQFGLRLGNEADCAAARAEILALEHVTARACVRTASSSDPDASVSSSPSA